MKNKFFEFLRKFNPLIIVFVFALLYYPPFFSFNILHMLTLISYVYIFIRKRYIYRNEIKYIQKMMFFFITLSIYVSVISVIGGNSLGIAFVYIRFLVEIFPCCFALSYMCKKRKYNFQDFLTLLIIVSSIQGVLSIISLIIPGVQIYFLNKAIQYGFEETKYLSFFGRRYYGFSYNLVTYAPIVHSCLGIFAICRAINKNKLYYIPAVVIIFSAIVNSRSSFIILAIGIILLMITSKNFKTTIKIALVILLSVFAFFILIDGLEIIAPYTYIWLKSGISGINMFLNGEISNNFDYFSSLEHWIDKVPKGFDFLVGRGQIVIGSDQRNIATDIGYINYLWIGGVPFFIAINYYFLRMIYNIGYHVKDKEVILLSMHIFWSLIIFNIKMPALLLDEFSIFIMIIYTFYYLNEKVEIL